MGASAAERDESYILEDTPEGRDLVVTGAWSREAAKALATGKADGLVLNRARGFSERSLDCLADFGIRRLRVLDHSVTDLEPITRLGDSLEELSVEAATDTELDLGALPRLQSLDGPWWLVGPTFRSLHCLRRVVTWEFSERDLHAFRDHVGLERLTVKDAPTLESMSGISDLPELATLKVIGGPRLRDISDVEWLAASLRRLRLIECASIESIDEIEALVGITFLELGDCGAIRSLAPVASLQQLEKVYLWGTTRAADDDLSPLIALPHLRELRMRERPGYRPTVAAVRAALDS